MSALSNKLRSVDGGMIAYWCPGCKHAHVIDAARWHWNGNVDWPTLHPSVRHYVPAVPEENWPEETLCHYFLVDGELRFCSDSRHEFAGKSVPLPDFPHGYSINGEIT